MFGASAKDACSLLREHTIVTCSAVAVITYILLFRVMQIYSSDCGGTWIVRCKYYRFISGVLGKDYSDYVR